MPYVRCSYCGARKTLARLPQDYQPGRVPKCPRTSCRNRQIRRGDEQRWRIDEYRQTKERGPGSPSPCYCGEYQGRTGNMPHRRRSGWCLHNPAISDADRQERWEGGNRK